MSRAAREGPIGEGQTRRGDIDKPGVVAGGLVPCVPFVEKEGAVGLSRSVVCSALREEWPVRVCEGT